MILRNVDKIQLDKDVLILHTFSYICINIFKFIFFKEITIELFFSLLYYNEYKYMLSGGLAEQFYHYPIDTTSDLPAVCCAASARRTFSCMIFNHYLS